MRTLSIYTLCIVTLCLGMISCSDDFEDYYQSSDNFNYEIGGAEISFDDLWHCSTPGVVNGNTLIVPTKGGKFLLTINPEATYTVKSHDTGETFGPYQVPTELYPVPDCISEYDGARIFYTCSKAFDGVWNLAYFGPLESPYGKVYMEKNSLVIDMNRSGKGGRDLILNIALCEQLEGNFADRRKSIPVSLKIVQGK